MKAAIYDICGSPDVLRYADVPDPQVEANDVLIEVEAISIEGGDLINRRLVQPPKPGHIVGYAAAGTVVAIGPSVTSRKVGDRVSSFAFDGSHAAMRAVDARQTWIVPDGVDFADAAALPISFGTAHHCLFARGSLEAGETVLVQAAAGGVGLATIQLAKRAGARVIAVSSGADRLARLRMLGADAVLDHRNDDVAAAVLDLTQGDGANLVVDPAGSTLQVSLSSLAAEGRLVFVGNAGGGRLAPDLWPAMQANQSLFGVFMGMKLALPEVAATVDHMLADLAASRLDAMIDSRFSLADAARAHDHAERGKPFGRVVMRP